MINWLIIPLKKFMNIHRQFLSNVVNKQINKQSGVKHFLLKFLTEVKSRWCSVISFLYCRLLQSLNVIPKLWEILEAFLWLLFFLYTSLFIVYHWILSRNNLYFYCKCDFFYFNYILIRPIKFVNRRSLSQWMIIIMTIHRVPGAFLGGGEGWPWPRKRCGSQWPPILYVKCKKMDYFCIISINLLLMCPQNVTSEGYKHKTFLLAPLAVSFSIPMLKMVALSMIAMVSSVRLTVTVAPS